MVDVSVIIVEYMDPGLLEMAVHSCLAHCANLNLEIIAVSNSSYDKSKQDKIRGRLPGVHFIFNQDNRGFAKGVNQGIALASGEFILLLNPDARLLDASLFGALEFMRHKPGVAVVGAMIVDQFGKVQDSCRQFMTLRVLAARTWSRLLGIASGPVLENRDYSREQKVDWVSGACLLARKAAIDDAGMLDERYFMYLEDMDWCMSFYRRGWEVCYYPNWQVEHNAGRGSTSNFWLTNRKMWIHLASLFKYYLKWSKI
jgi:hypothetical protein